MNEQKNFLFLCMVGMEHRRPSTSTYVKEVERRRKYSLSAQDRAEASFPKWNGLPLPLGYLPLERKRIWGKKPWSNQEDREGGKYIHIYCRDSGHLMNYVEIAKSTYLFHVNEFQSLMQFVIFCHFFYSTVKQHSCVVYVVIWHWLSVDCLHK